MADEQREFRRRQRRRDGRANGRDTLTVTDNRTGETYELEITDGTVRAIDLRQIKVSRGRLRHDDLRPGVHEHGLLPLGDHLHRRRGRNPAAPRLSRSSSSASTRPTLRSPTCSSSASCRPPPSSSAGSSTSPTTPSSTRTSSSLHGDVPLRRPPDGHAALQRRRALDLLSRREADRRSRGALHGGDPADRQDADPGRLRLPPQHGTALRLSRQRAQLRRELPLDDVQEDRVQVRARPAPGEGARRALHPARRPRAELLDQRGALGRLLARRPVLRASPPGWRRCTARCTAAPTRRC